MSYFEKREDMEQLQKEASNQEFIEQLKKAIYELKREKNRREDLHGMNVALLRMWETSCGGTKEISPSSLAEHLQLSRSMVTTILNLLEKEGYISRSISSKDRRRVAVSITEKGKLYMEKRKNSMDQLFTYIYQYLGEADSQELVRLIYRLNEAMNHYQDTPQKEK